MQESSVPEEIGYNKIRARGFYTKFTQWPVYPNSSNQYWNNDEIVRFQVDLKQKGTVCDPYRSHIEFTVSVNEQMFPVGGVQVDNSAQSFVSQMVMSSNAAEIERIAEYDTLACYLTDLGFSEFVCENRTGEGLGYTNIPTHNSFAGKPFQTEFRSAPQLFSKDNNPVLGVENRQQHTGLTVPTQCPYSAPVGRKVNGEFAPYWELMNGTQNNHISSQNGLWNPTQIESESKMIGQTPLKDLVNFYKRVENIRCEYMEGALSNSYPEAYYSNISTGFVVQNQDWNYDTMTTKGYNKNNPYTLNVEDRSPTEISIMGTYKTRAIDNLAGIYGYRNGISSEYCKGALEPFLSPTVPQVGMKNGQILARKVPLVQKTFRIPLLSAIFGVLIPPDQFQLIPLEALNNLILELTLSRYAMFTSGYSDVHEFDVVGMSNPQRRQWLLSNFAWNLHLYSFGDPEVIGSIEAQLTKSIAITAYGYALSSSYQITTGQNVKGEYTIAAQYESLCEVFCVFIPNEYQQKTFLRKQFRISNNVSQLQFRINTDFYPIQPITGNAGNPESLDTTGDNWNFYEQIMLSNNFLFNTNHPSPKINTKNFAINGRTYRTDNQYTLYNQNMKDNVDLVPSLETFNFDTAMGMSKYHENRYIGKALYTYTWEPYGHSKTYLNGLNTTGTRNFQVIFNTIPQDYYPKDQTLYIFSKYNQINVYGKDGIRVFGK